MLKRKYTRLYAAIVGAIFTMAMLVISSDYAQAEVSADQSTAVIFVYQRVGEDSVPQSNISVERFKEHITELTKGGYSVLPLPQVIDALKNDSPLPPKTVGITFEGGYQPTIAKVMPLLRGADRKSTRL